MINGAVGSGRRIRDEQLNTGEMVTRGPATAALAAALPRRGSECDLQESYAAADRLAAAPADSGFVLHEISLPRLRALREPLSHRLE